MSSKRDVAAYWLGPGSLAVTLARFTDEFDRGWPRLQILTLAELFQGKRPAIPFVDALVALRRARREETERQGSLL